MNEEEFIKPINNIELGSNLDILSVNELSEYIKNLKNKKYEALDLAKKIFQ